MLPLLFALSLQASLTHPGEFPFTMPADGEAVATITAQCDGCAWSVAGHEAALLALQVDRRYSPHLALTRGDTPADYSVMLGPLTRGAHRLTVTRDKTRSAADA